MNKSLQQNITEGFYLVIKYIFTEVVLIPNCGKMFLF